MKLLRLGLWAWDIFEKCCIFFQEKHSDYLQKKMNKEEIQAFIKNREWTFARNQKENDEYINACNRKIINKHK